MLLLVLPGCSAFGLGKPSAHALGVGAREAGFFDDKGATDCVGKLIRDARLSRETLEHVAGGDLDGSDPNWVLGEDEAGPFDYWVEWKMAKKCGVTPWMTAEDVGRNALKGGLIDDPSKANCVGAMIRDSALNERFRGILSNTSFDHREENWWYLTERRRKAFHTVIESNMRARCGVDPWPKTTPWHEPVTPRTSPVK
jgi:hypothetical protein